MYAGMAKANGIDPTSGQAVAFNVTAKLYMDTLHDIVMQPVINVRSLASSSLLPLLLLACRVAWTSGGRIGSKAARLACT